MVFKYVLKIISVDTKELISMDSKWLGESVCVCVGVGALEEKYAKPTVTRAHTNARGHAAPDTNTHAHTQHTQTHTDTH